MRRMLHWMAGSAGSSLPCAALGILPATGAGVATLEVFHADSLAGPLREIKRAFEARMPGLSLRLTSGVSRQLAARIVRGEVCDVFAPSSPAVIDEDLMNQPAAGFGAPAASWYVVFSANEMVIITARGNPLRIRTASDLAKPGVRVARVTGDKDLATGRSIEFIRRATALEGKAELAQTIVAASAGDAGKSSTVPDTVDAVRQRRADAGVVYLSAAVAAGEDVDVLRFPDSVNMSEAIRNAAVVPATARTPGPALQFVSFLLSDEARRILQQTGQPPVIPAIRKGNVPVEITG